MKCENCNEQLKSQIEPIINHFNFEKVRKVMDFVGWKWYDGQPSTQNLVETARQILNETVKHDTTEISTGGFRTSKLEDEFGNPYLELAFILEHQDAEYGFDE